MRHLLITTLLSAAMGLGSVYAQGKYAVHGVVIDTDSLPMTNVGLYINNDSLLGGTDSLGRYGFQTDVLPIKIRFKSVGSITHDLVVTKQNYAALPPVVMDEEVIIDFLDGRGSLKVTAKELEQYGDYADILFGMVYDENDSLPLIGAVVKELTPKGKEIGSVLTDQDGHFYMPLEQLPTIVEITYIGLEPLRKRITKKNIKERHKFYMLEDTRVIVCH